MIGRRALIFLINIYQQIQFLYDYINIIAGPILGGAIV